MLFSDCYTEPEKESHAYLRESASRFYSFVFPVFSETEIKQILADLSGKYPDATHHCYAYILHPDKNTVRAADDGEPPNSAGKPILREIQRSNLTNILVVVVRYFGGTKLGIPGLIAAYGKAAELAIREAGKRERVMEETVRISAGHGQENEVYCLLRKVEGRPVSVTSSDRSYFEVAVRLSQVANFKQIITQHQAIQLEK